MCFIKIPKEEFLNTGETDDLKTGQVIEVFVEKDNKGYSNQFAPIKLIEKNIEPYDVYSADEAFISATPFCMLPVVSLNNIKIGNGKVGKIYNKFLETWSRNVGVNIKSQIKNWDKKKKLKVTPYRFKK